MFLGFIGICAYDVIWHINNYNEYVYPFNKAEANFDRATATSDLADAADYCEKVYKFIDDYHGNPDWAYWAKTDSTNWDLIKKDLKSLIDESREADNNTNSGSDAYEEALTILHDKIEGTEESYGLRHQINHNFDLELYKHTWIPFWILLIFTIALFVSLLIMATIIDTYN